MPVVDAAQGGSAPLPVRLLSARECAEMALQKIGAYTINDSAADAHEVERALQWMEIAIAHTAGVHRLQWLIPTTVEFDLESDIAQFDLEDVLGASFPSLGVAYPIAAWVGTVIDPDDDAEEVSYTEIDIVRRAQYESHDNKMTSGVPEEIYIDRLNDNKNLFVYPVVDTSVNVRVRLQFQTYPRSVQGQGSENTSGDTAHGFDVTWQKWIIAATAAEIGDGPVRRLDTNTIGKFKAEAAAALTDLMSSQNREKITHRLHRTRRYGG